VDGQSYTGAVTLWTRTSGPGTVQFANAAALETTASFTQAGSNLLWLTATAGWIIVKDSTTITVVEGNTTNTLPYQQSFERYQDGTMLVGMDGWYASNPSSAVVVTNNYTNNYTGTFPITDEGHERVLKIDGWVTNKFQSLETNVVLDVMMNLAAWKPITPPRIDPGAQFGFCLNTNGYLMVGNCQNPETNPTNVWTELPDTNIGTNEWVRYTVEANYNRSTNGYFYFRIWVADALVTNPATWFASASTNQNHLSEIAILGERRWIDDLVVLDNSGTGGGKGSQKKTLKDEADTDGARFGMAPAGVTAGSRLAGVGDQSGSDVDQVASVRLRIAETNGRLVVMMPMSAGPQGVQRFYSLEMSTNPIVDQFFGVEGYTNVPGEEGVLVYTNETPVERTIFFRGKNREQPAP